MAELARGIERARRLVQQLLDYARLEPGVPTEPALPVDLARLAREVVGEFAVRAEERSVDLGAEASEVATISARDSELRSLVENLVDNALRYAPPGTTVTIAVRRTSAAIEMCVVDSGPGIPPSERNRAFERFCRVAGDTTSGTGLGLAIAKAIVERHHGSITLEDAHPRAQRPGLSVTIRFPVPEPLAKRSDVPRTDPPPARQAGEAKTALRNLSVP